MPRIAVIFTGGTISMRATLEAGGNTPTLSGAELLRAIPDIERLADLELVDWGLVPGSHLTFDQVLSIGRTIAEQLARPEIDGAVVVQGTDNMEETSFAWDLLPLPDKPVVVVGAMRSASQEGYDGPDNLRNAVACAIDPALRGQGVVVAMAGEIHGADAVRKTHTHAYGTFRSVNMGTLGVVAHGRVDVSRTRRPFRLPVFPERAVRVPLVTAILDGGPLELGKDAAGLVVQAMGGGNTHYELLEEARGLIDRGVPVVLASRCPSGQVRPGYGFPGGSTTWWEAGAIFSGDLGGLKSRVALALALGADLDRRQLVGLFAHYGGGANA